MRMIYVLLIGLLISDVAFARRRVHDSEESRTPEVKQENLPKVFPDCGPGHTRIDKEETVSMSLQYTDGFHIKKYGGEPNATVYVSICVDEKTKKMDGPMYVYQYYNADTWTVIVEKLAYKQGELTYQHWLKTTQRLFDIENGNY